MALIPKRTRRPKQAGKTPIAVAVGLKRRWPPRARAREPTGLAEIKHNVPPGYVRSKVLLYSRTAAADGRQL